MKFHLTIYSSGIFFYSNPDLFLSQVPDILWIKSFKTFAFSFQHFSLISPPWKLVLVVFNVVTVLGWLCGLDVILGWIIQISRYKTAKLWFTKVKLAASFQSLKLFTDLCFIYQIKKKKPKDVITIIVGLSLIKYFTTKMLKISELFPSVLCLSKT